MHWKALEKIIHDNTAITKEAEVEQLSQQLLGDLKDDTHPLQAARAAYVLTLLQIKLEKPSETKSLQFVQYLRTILKHEIQGAEGDTSEHSQAHLVYVRKLAEHYFHHLMVLAEVKGLQKVLNELHSLRKSNHLKLIKLQQTTQSFWKQEQKLIKDSIKNHYLFVGFLFSIALYFAWTSLWSLADTAFQHWIYSTYSAEQLGELVQNAFLLLFSGSFMIAFVKYQRAAKEEV